MKTLKLLNYERDRWVAGDGNLVEIPSAIDGTPVAMTGSGGIDFGGMLRHAREVGGPALRKLTFHDRAHLVTCLFPQLCEPTTDVAFANRCDLHVSQR